MIKIKWYREEKKIVGLFTDYNIMILWYFARDGNTLLFFSPFLSCIAGMKKQERG